MLTERLANLNFVTNVMCDSREDPDAKSTPQEEWIHGNTASNRAGDRGFSRTRVRSLLRAIADRSFFGFEVLLGDREAITNRSKSVS
jgi:hypothetical protein